MRTHNFAHREPLNLDDFVRERPLVGTCPGTVPKRRLPRSNCVRSASASPSSQRTGTRPCSNGRHYRLSEGSPQPAVRSGGVQGRRWHRPAVPGHGRVLDQRPGLDAGGRSVARRLRCPAVRVAAPRRPSPDRYTNQRGASRGLGAAVPVTPPNRNLSPANPAKKAA